MIFRVLTVLMHSFCDEINRPIRPIVLMANNGGYVHSGRIYPKVGGKNVHVWDVQGQSFDCLIESTISIADESQWRVSKNSDIMVNNSINRCPCWFSCSTLNVFTIISAYRLDKNSVPASVNASGHVSTYRSKSVRQTAPCGAPCLRSETPSTCNWRTQSSN